MAKEMNGEMDKESLRQLLEKHESEPGALIPILQEIQESFGYLPEEALVFVSEEVEIPLGKIYGVVTFYSQFYLSPRGKNIIRVCHGTACHIGGAERISEAVSEELGVGEGATTEDGEFTVERVACLGCCSLAPCVMVNDETHARLSPRKIKRIVKKYRKTRVD
jgi:NADH-quinone oxidoreductase subunit E